jgi:putative transposase
VKYAWIREHRDSFPVSESCRVLRVSTSGYYHARERPSCPRAERHGRIQAAVAAIHAASHGIYGSLKITRALQQADEATQEKACRNTVAKAMRELGLKSCVAKAFKPTTTKSDPSQRPAPNTLDRNFTAAEPNRKWVTDITYLATAAGWVYLAVVIDLFSRKAVGWAISASLATELVSQALRNAVEARRPDGAKLLHHSDRGCQYTSDDYQRTLKALGIECSMSRTGECYDNAVAERFFWSLKHEWTNHAAYENLEAARLGVFQYIETFYNSTRLHQTLGYLTPNQFEAQKSTALPLKPDHAPEIAA